MQNFDANNHTTQKCNPLQLTLTFSFSERKWNQTRQDIANIIWCGVRRYRLPDSYVIQMRPLKFCFKLIVTITKQKTYNFKIRNTEGAHATIS